MPAPTGTIDQLIAGIEIEEEAAQKRRDKASLEVKSIIAFAGQEGRSHLTPEEDQRVTELFAMRDAAKADIEGIRVKLANANKVKAEDELDRKELRNVSPTGVPLPKYDEVARVTREQRTYNPDVDRKGALFVKDVIRQFLFADPQASHRLSRHMHEEQVERSMSIQGAMQRANGQGQVTRAVGTGAFTGLVVPQYLTDMYAPAVAAMRPFADICNHHDLPEAGMTVNISRITTPSTVTLQANEGDAVSATDMDDTLLTESIQTAAGQQTISRQAIERGTGIEEVVVDDLFRRYATALDATLITQATTGLSAVSQAVTYTDASPSGTECWPKLLQGAANAEAALLGFAQPDVVLMHSRRWYWLQSQLSSQWPLFGQPGLVDNHGGMNYATRYGSGARGILPNGMVAVVDNNILTTTNSNQDEIYVVASDEAHLWEDPAAPVFLRCEQPAAATLGVLLVLYGYFAYSFRRYTNAFSKIGGSGLTTPTF